MRRTGYIALALLSLQFVHCEYVSSVVDQVGDRLRVLQVQPSFAGVGIAPIYPPVVDELIGLARTFGLVKGSAARPFTNPLTELQKLRDSIGIAVICSVAIHNPNEKRAAFDGADFFLHVNDPNKASNPFSVLVDAFLVEGGSTIVLPIRFPIMISNPLFSSNLLDKVFYGQGIPYNLSATLELSLLEPLTGDTLGFTTQPLDLVTDSIPTRPSSQTMGIIADAVQLLVGG